MRSWSLGGKHRPSHVIIPHLWSVFIPYQSNPGDLHLFPQLPKVLWSLGWALVAVLSSRGNYNSSLWFSRHLH